MANDVEIRQQELKTILETSDDMSSEALRKAVQLTLRETHYYEIQQCLLQFLKHMTEVSVPKYVIETVIQCHCAALLSAHVKDIEGIKESVGDMADALPSDLYNLRSALETFVHYLDPSIPDAYQAAGQRACCELRSQTIQEKPIYTQYDLETEYSRAYALGYQKALDNKEKDTPNTILQELDID